MFWKLKPMRMRVSKRVSSSHFRIHVLYSCFQSAFLSSFFLLFLSTERELHMWICLCVYACACDIGIKATTFTLEDIMTKFDKHEVISALQCAGNRQEDYVTEFRPLYVAPHWREGAIGNARWAGVKVRDVLHAAGEIYQLSTISYLYMYRCMRSHIVLQIIYIFHNTYTLISTRLTLFVSFLITPGLFIHAFIHSPGMPVDDIALGKRRPGGKIVNFIGMDVDETGVPYGGVIPVEKALDPFGDAILAYEMNGETLPRDHGYPLRLLAPGHAGCRNVKWVGSISVTEKPSDLDSGSRLDRHFAPDVNWESHKGHVCKER